jgi:DNA polymerase-3 subunit delta'
MCAQKPHESFRACGQCEPCRKLARGNHPDFIFVEPETQKIKIDQIRRIMHQAHFRPIAHRRRWVLLNESDCMNENAQNSLLRTLEEPPEDTHFILINHSLERLLPTIRSRCQSIRFAPLKTQEVQAVFQMLGVKSEDMAHLIALSHGSPGHGYQCTQEEIFEIRQEILTILSKSPHISQEGQRRWNFLLLAQKLGGHKNLQPIILEIMQSFYRDLALYQLGIEHAEMANQDFLGEYEPLKNVPLENQWESYAIISQMFSDFRFNTHSELTFNQGFLQLNGTTHEQR